MGWAWIPDDRLRELAREIDSNGCSGVLQFYQSCCIPHDVAYRRHVDPVTGEPITRAEADRKFRACLQVRSKFGVWSPLSWWRWAGVRLFGRRAWGAGVSDPPQ